MQIQKCLIMAVALFGSTLAAPILKSPYLGAKLFRRQGSNTLPADYCAHYEDGNYPDPNTVADYVACVDHSAYEMPCPLDLDGTLLHYVQNSGPDPEKSYCDYPAVNNAASDGQS